MEISFLPILVCAIVSMVAGSIWYGPLFGKAWARVIKADPDCMTDPVKRKEANKKAMPLYLLQFILSLVTVFVLAIFINTCAPFSSTLLETKYASTYLCLPGGAFTGVKLSLLIFVGFILPMAAGGSMWNNDTRKDAWTKFFLTAGFQLVLFIIFGLILSSWR